VFLGLSGLVQRHFLTEEDGAQLCTLERRTSRAGRDSINHAPNAHDDVGNAAAGTLYMAFARPPLDIWQRVTLN
jgi:hypothetical protein